MNARISAIFSVFSSRDFSIFTAGNSLSLVGVWVQRMAVGWLAWDLTQSGFWLGAVAFADLFPAIIIGPFAGVFADRLDRRHILIVCKILVTLQAVALTGLVLTGMTIEVLFGLALFGGIVIGIQQPARLAIVPSLVRSEHLAQAVAINSVIFNLARPIGSAVAGVLITVAGNASAFAFVSVSHLAIIGALMVLRLPTEPTVQRHGVLSEIAEGVRYVFAHPAIGPLIVLAIIGSVLGRPVFELLPGFADEVFGWGAGGYAILNSAVGIGAILAGLWLAQRQGGVTGLTRITLLSFVAVGVLCIAFGVTRSFWIGVVLMTLAGGVMLINGAGTQTLIQVAVAGHMRGRALSIWGITFRGGPAIGSLAMGSLASYWGFGLPVALGGGACVLVGMWMYRRRADLVRQFEAEEATDHIESAPAVGGAAAASRQSRSD